MDTIRTGVEMLVYAAFAILSLSLIVLLIIVMKGRFAKRTKAATVAAPSKARGNIRLRLLWFAVRILWRKTRGARRAARQAWHKTTDWSSRWTTRQERLGRIFYKRYLPKKLRTVRKHTRVRAKLAWRMFKRSPTGDWFLHSPAAIAQGILAIVAILYLGYRLDQATGSALETIYGYWAYVVAAMRSADWKFWGLVALGVLLLAGLGLWLWKNPPSAATAQNVPWGRYLWNAAKVAVVLLVIVFAYRAYSNWLPEGTYLVTRQWSPEIIVHPGQDATWEPFDDVDFELMTQSGKKYLFAKSREGDMRTPCEKHVRITEALKRFRLRVIDKEVESTKFLVTFYPYGQGNKCADVDASEDFERIPDGIPGEEWELKEELEDEPERKPVLKDKGELRVTTAELP